MMNKTVVLIVCAGFAIFSVSVQAATVKQADSLAEFSSTQGAGGWYYGTLNVVAGAEDLPGFTYNATTDFVESTSYVTDHWETNGTHLYAAGALPLNGVTVGPYAVRRYVAEFTGTAKIDYLWNSIAASANWWTGWYGAQVYKNGVSILNPSGDPGGACGLGWSIGGSGNSFDVVAGDKIDFVTTGWWGNDQVLQQQCTVWQIFGNNYITVATQNTEFSGVQGQDNWYYQTKYPGTALSYNGTFWTDGDATIENSGPRILLGGTNEYPSIEWSSEITGPVRLSGTFSLQGGTPTANSSVHISINGKDVFGEAIGVTNSFGQVFNVNAGDRVQFWMAPNTGSEIVVGLENVRIEIYGASMPADFSGTQGQLNWKYRTQYPGNDLTFNGTFWTDDDATIQHSGSNILLGGTNEYPCLQWTSAKTEEIEISGVFSLQDGTPTASSAVYISKNGSTIWGGEILPSIGFHKRLDVAAGDTLWFWMAPNTGSQITVGLSNLTITSTMYSDLGHGRDLLLDRGLQIQAQTFAQNNQFWSQTDWTDSNFTTINTNWGNDWYPMYQYGSDYVWGRYQWNPVGDPPTTVNYVTVYEDVTTMISWQLGDENVSGEDDMAKFAAWKQTVRNQPEYDDILLYTNQPGATYTEAQLDSYMQSARPDMMMFDTYPFGQSYTGGSPTWLYRDMSKYRNVALKGYDGSGDYPLPYGLYLQTCVTASGTYPPLNYRPSESEIRLNQFAAWAFGYTFVSAYVYDEPNTTGSGTDSLLFASGGSNPARTIEFDYVASTNAQSRALGTSFVQLKSTGIYIQAGVNSGTNHGISDFPTGGSSVDANIPYITAITAVNDSGVNGNVAGDVLLGLFKPLYEKLDGDAWTNEKYFMVVNGLTWPGKTAAQTQQTVTLTFDFGTSGITQLQRVNRDTGAVEDVGLTHISGTTYAYTWMLDGGTGDLFKFKTGAPFVGKYCGSLGYLDGDFNEDCYVNLADFADMVDNWLNGTDTTDLDALTDSWLECNDTDAPCYYIP